MGVQGQCLQGPLPTRSQGPPAPMPGASLQHGLKDALRAHTRAAGAGFRPLGNPDPLLGKVSSHLTLMLHDAFCSWRQPHDTACP